MQKVINHPSIMKLLDWTYEKAIHGFPGLNSASELALTYMEQEGTLREKADSLIRWQNAKSGASGFVTGIGGLITLPVSIPANLASVLFVQVRMIAAIAYMGGHDLRDDKVKTLVYICLAGNVAKDLLQETGIIIGTRLTAQVVKSISEKSLIAINERVGFRLLATYGSKGIISLGKAVPLVGGLIGGGIDIFATNMIGNMARNAFIPASV
jgi:hypothetical protein